MHDVGSEIVGNYAYFSGVRAYFEEIDVELAHWHLRECILRVKDVFYNLRS